MEGEQPATRIKKPSNLLKELNSWNGLILIFVTFLTLFGGAIIWAADVAHRLSALEAIAGRSLGKDGKDGLPGSPVELRLTAGAIQWRRENEELWQNLVPLDKLRGPAGPPGLLIGGDAGQNGKDGVPGAPVELRVADGAIQWKRENEIQWRELIKIDAIGESISNSKKDSEYIFSDRYHAAVAFEMISNKILYFGPEKIPIESYPSQDEKDRVLYFKLDGINHSVVTGGSIEFTHQRRCSFNFASRISKEKVFVRISCN